MMHYAQLVAGYTLTAAAMSAAVTSDDLTLTVTISSAVIGGLALLVRWTWRIGQDRAKIGGRLDVTEAQIAELRRLINEERAEARQLEARFNAQADATSRKGQNRKE